MLKSRMSFVAMVLLGLLGSGPARADDTPAATVSSPQDERLFSQFPRRALYLDIITREALARGLPPAVADAVVRIESGYDPSVVGTVGEIGLMQVRPATAALLGFTGTATELAVPSTNIRYGVAYLAKAWRLADGDLCRALMKYRAGHGEDSMSPLSAEYCRRARVHLAALGWSPGEGGGAAPAPVRIPVRVAETGPKRATEASGPKLISVRSSAALLAANRASIAAAWARISVMRRR